MNFNSTQYGFVWGSLEVRRWCSDDKKGWVAMGVHTPKYKNGLQLYVTKSGKVRVFDGDKEWKP